jgi:hypothetical protein
MVCGHCRALGRWAGDPPCPVCGSHKFRIALGSVLGSVLTVSIVVSPLIIIFLALTMIKGIGFILETPDGWFLPGILLITWVPSLVFSVVIEYLKKDSEAAIKANPSMSTIISIGEHIPGRNAIVKRNTAYRDILTRIIVLVSTLVIIVIAMFQFNFRSVGDNDSLFFLLFDFLAVLTGIGSGFSIKILISTPYKIIIDDEGFRALYPFGYELGSKWTDIKWIGPLKGGWLTDADRSADYHHLSLNMKGVRLVELDNLIKELKENIIETWEKKKKPE